MVIEKHKYPLLIEVLFFVASIINVLAIILPNKDLEIIEPVPLLLLTVLYVVSVKRVKKLFVFAFLLFSLGDFMFFLENYFTATFSFIVGNLLLTILLSQLIRKLLIKRLFSYLLIFLSFFTIIFLFVIEGGNPEKALVFFYGIGLCLLAAMAFSSFLERMNRANLLVLLGVFTKLISDSIYSLYLFENSENTTGLLVVVTYLVSNYLICKGFVGMDKKRFSIIVE